MGKKNFERTKIYGRTSFPINEEQQKLIRDVVASRPDLKYFSLTDQIRTLLHEKIKEELKRTGIKKLQSDAATGI